MTVTVNLSPELEDRLKALVSKSGLSTDAQLEEIIGQGLEDMEDYYAAQDVLARVNQKTEKVISSEDFWRDLEN